MTHNGRGRGVSTSRQIFIVTLCVFNGCLCKCLRETYWFQWENLCDLFLCPNTNLNKAWTMFIISRTVQVNTHTHSTCYTRYSCHDKPEVRTLLCNLEDGEDIWMGLKEPVLSTQTGYIWHWMGIGDCCKHRSESSRSIKFWEFIDWCTSCCLPNIEYYVEFVTEFSV